MRRPCRQTCVGRWPAPTASRCGSSASCRECLKSSADAGESCRPSPAILSVEALVADLIGGRPADIATHVPSDSLGNWQCRASFPSSARARAARLPDGFLNSTRARRRRVPPRFAGGYLRNTRRNSARCRDAQGQNFGAHPNATKCARGNQSAAGYSVRYCLLNAARLFPRGYY